ncbi:hypothetical protein EBF03_03540 [Arcanobacterium haemolyticum]|uniref:zinc ribbon domain-containing protein n=1 Tax=Arcanobacterium haemolyticum TaxID=28264 RepID=UPI0011101C98|nr:hypothetical protein [Arcanobacterium haemolyticum]QCX46586.1 hypothetical protein EBF03_03540 [Arcanobacterium haemolyticum]
MYQAPRPDQLALLDVAELDAQINRLKRNDKQHPLRADVGETMNLVAAASRDITAAESALAHATEELDHASEESERVRAVVGEKETRFNSGAGMDSRQLLTLQSEIEANKARLDELETAEFAALEAVEAAEKELAAAKERQTYLNAQLVTQRNELEETIGLIHRDISDIELRRESIYNPIADALKRAYEHAKAGGGLSVIALQPDGSTSGGVALSPIEISQIRHSAPDEFHISDDYGCVVIRDPDFPLE